ARDLADEAGDVDAVPGELHQQLGVKRGVRGRPGRGHGLEQVRQAVHADHGGEEEPARGHHVARIEVRSTLWVLDLSVKAIIQALNRSMISACSLPFVATALPPPGP